MIFELARFIPPVGNWFWRRTNDVRSRIFHARTWKTKKCSSIEKMKFDGASDVLCATGERKVDKKWTGYIARKKASGAKSSGWTDGLHSGSMQRKKKKKNYFGPRTRDALSIFMRRLSRVFRCLTTTTTLYIFINEHCDAQRTRTF